ncbi:MAG: hypothetical protein FD163_1829 [Hyphomonadaceae bacterium]|nr:MAG: hypothetical protein FD128_552 [Hyphomonadaceae bacterium]KAF0184255.1 MAG: hypothetical protein FD163_1829 [Hyphomonadaceae bacterium]
MDLSGFRIGELSIEMTVLLLAVILGMLHVLGQSLSGYLDRGTKWALGLRDDAPPLSITAARIERASTNFKENFPIFIALMLIVEITGKSNGITQAMAVTWLGARTLYYPIYALGSKLRPYIYTVSVFAVFTILFQLFTN